MPAPFCSIRSGDCPPPSAARKTPACCWPTRKPATTRPGPAACPTCSITGRRSRLKEAGADCVKILLYYTPYDPKDVNDKKHAWVERIGDECRANDIPFFLEFVGYEEGADEKGLEYAKKKPHIVTESMREFSKDRYGVDVLKVEVPVNMKFVEGDEVVRRREGIHEEGSDRPVPQGCQRSRPSRSFIFRLASATPSSARRWNWRANRA